MSHKSKQNQDSQILELESKRKHLYRKLTKIGDFRRGTISVNYRKCGNPNCACAKPGHPGHGPQFLWNTTSKRKSLAKNLKPGPELHKYTQEIDNYHQFINIQKEIIQVNEEICNRRPLSVLNENETEKLKKKLLKFYNPKFKKK